MRSTAVTFALLLLFAVLPSGSAAAATSGVAEGWREVLRIDSAIAGPQKAFEAFDTASLNLYDFDGDGQLEIVSHNDNNRAYVIDSRTGQVLTEIATYRWGGDTYPVRELSPISIGPLYGDGRPCMVIPNSMANMSAWCFDHNASTRESFVFDKMWEITVDAARYEPNFKATHPWLYAADGKRKSYPGLDGHAYLADADGDGTLEVYVETDSFPGQFAFSHDGKYLWSRSFADGNAGAKVMDIDKDGRKEAVFVSDAGILSAFDAKTGAIRWVFEASRHGANPGSVPVPPLFADLDGDGHVEAVFGTRNIAPLNSTDWINESHAIYFAVDSKGRELWNVSYDWMNPLQYNHPAAADVNGDGVLDVIFIDWNTVGHKPGNWDITNRKPNLFALDGRDGSLLWRRGIDIYWSNKDFVIADADGDGRQDIIAPTARGGSDGLGIYDLKTGETKGWVSSNWSLTRGPVAGDLYGDGKLYLVVPVSKRSTEPNYRQLDVGLRVGALSIVGTDVPYKATFSANFLFSDVEAKGPRGDGGTVLAPLPSSKPTEPPVEPAPEIEPAARVPTATKFPDAFYLKPTAPVVERSSPEAPIAPTPPAAATDWVLVATGLVAAAALFFTVRRARGLGARP